ncbi:MAG: restriction endonuclease subunit S [Microcystis aeruginosa Ma_QC_Ch_20071001_S25]|uniref:Restriction endonuclease subunit S n=1 Tax=Microcystis aeruginosa Ma_QC_Ch_20071001_S25D TaxID=2486250 RepID=A0A552FT36_MICAE|nr:MAG: restriction endonuclease subunit S [Microcystis aeruginosa Ma_QC_Ch_20071001_S25]TRU49856.1 MAG: restriction endonuclease subunit S [Microcystis aeruginosa Ma_QC_Ch_20071001_S25D]TRU60695.1 MAG: restriction endonuclease subunit S [Microcystis aeruginosa Ma_QC_Ch_20071001_M135]
MKNWDVKKLRDLADIRVSNVDKKIYPSERPVKLCNYMDVYTNEYIDGSIQFMEGSANDAEIERFGLNIGDVIITKDSETPDDIGIPTVIHEQIDNLVCGYHLALIRPDNEKIDSIFLSKYLSTSRVANYFALHASGSTRFGLPIGAIESVEILTPPIKEQTQIATILSTIDRAIEQTEALIAKQQRIKTGLMQDLLTKGIDENGNIRSEETHEFKDSAIGRIPVEWEVKSLDELTTKIGDGIHTTPAYSENTGFFFINGNNLGDGSIHITSDTLCVNQGEFRKYYIELDDRTILYSINGTIGNIAFYKNEPVVLGKSAAYIKCKKSVNARLIYHILQSEPVHRFYDYELTGSTIKNLSLAAMRATPIKIPRMQEEQEFLACRLDLCVYEIGQANNCLSKLRSLKTGLMQDLLTGKVRVTELIKERETDNL